jgi:hypothetical protein
MKCLKSAKTGNIIRIDDIQAHNMVGREWQYVSKEQWKSTTRKSEPVIEPTKTISDSIIRGYEGETISEKQLKRKKK